MLSETVKRNLTIGAVCTGGLALLLYPASMLTLGLGLALGVKGKDWLTGGERG